MNHWPSAPPRPPASPARPPKSTIASISEGVGKRAGFLEDFALFSLGALGHYFNFKRVSAVIAVNEIYEACSPVVQSFDPERVRAAIEEFEVYEACSPLVRHFGLKKSAWPSLNLPRFHPERLVSAAGFFDDLEVTKWVYTEALEYGGRAVKQAIRDRYNFELAEAQRKGSPFTDKQKRNWSRRNKERLSRGLRAWRTQYKFAKEFGFLSPPPWLAPYIK